jgi:ferredoxin
VSELFLAYLGQHDDGAWHRAIDRIERAIHPVDRTAIRIWLHFYPLALQRVMARPDAATLARKMTLAGRWSLADQVDTSHRFLFGHRYWSQARDAVLAYASASTAPDSLDLGMQIQAIAQRVANDTGAPAEQVVAITAVAMRTLQQVGPAALLASTGAPRDEGAYRGLTADDVMRLRERRRNKAWLGFFGGASSQQSMVTFDERSPEGKFPLVHSQHLTTAAALDTRQFRLSDPRCSEGPIPVHCRSCSCGTCWVGVLAGAENTGPMEARERDKLRECGVEVEGERPEIRLACMTQATGPVSIVIPPWNGLLGRAIRKG